MIEYLSYKVHKERSMVIDVYSLGAWETDKRIGSSRSSRSSSAKIEASLPQPCQKQSHKTANRQSPGPALYMSLKILYFAQY